MEKCRGCGADIIWIITQGDKRMPLDAKPEKRFITDRGKEEELRGYMRDTYTSHFATCPKAAEFRK